MFTYTQNHLNSSIRHSKFHLDLLFPIRQWLDAIEVKEIKLARFICRLIPASCPFERSVKLWKLTLHIPPLCKLNPLYNELVGLRFRALSYLGENEKL